MGFAFGFIGPNFTGPPPTVIAPELFDAFNQGRLTGQQGAIDGLALSTDCVDASREPPPGAEAVMRGGDVLEGLGIAFDVLMPRPTESDSFGIPRRGRDLIQHWRTRRFAMTVPLRADYDAARVRRAAHTSNDASQVRRLLAVAAIYDGASRTQAAEIGGVTLQIVRDWVLRFNADGADGLVDRKPPGQPSRLTDEHRAALAAMIESGPIPAVHGVVRWRIIDLCQWVWDEFEISVSKQTLSRELRAMGYRKLSARPRHHAQTAGAMEAFKKTGPRRWRRSHASVASIPAI
jgi:putative transposase